VFVESLRTLGRRVSDAVDNSVLAGVFRTLHRWVRNSWLYRWLTTEPDSQAVVIDLRETYTVGPVLAVFDRLIGMVTRRRENTATRSFFHRTGQEARSHPVRSASFFLVGVLLAELVVSTLAGALSGIGVVIRGVFFVLALAGTRVTTPWEHLRTARAIRILKAALESPEPPDVSDASANDEGDE